MDTTRVLVDAAERGGQELMRFFGTELQITQKSAAADVVTEADRTSEKVILSILQEKFPDYSILTEETGFIDKQSDYRLVVDPLDGSHNFVLGIPNFSVSIALQRDEQTIAAAVHHPVLQKTVAAERGKGVHLNGNALAVNSETELRRSTIAHVRNYVASAERTNTLYSALSSLGVKRFLSNWSPAWDFVLLTSGKIEAIILDVTTQKEIYDSVAGKLMTREAGGRITDFAGKDDPSDTNTQFIASNSTALHDELVSILAACNY